MGVEVGDRASSAEPAHLVGLVIVDRQPVTFAIFHPMNIGAGNIDVSGGRRVRSRHHLEQRGLAGTIGSDNTDDRRPIDHEIGLEREGWATQDAPLGVDLAYAIEHQQRRTHQ